MGMAATKQAGTSDWQRRLGLTDQEAKQLEERADAAQRSIAAEIRMAVKAWLT